MNLKGFRSFVNFECLIKLLTCLELGSACLLLYTVRHTVSNRPATDLVGDIPATLVRITVSNRVKRLRPETKERQESTSTVSTELRCPICLRICLSKIGLLSQNWTKLNWTLSRADILLDNEGLPTTANTVRQFEVHVLFSTVMGQRCKSKQIHPQKRIKLFVEGFNYITKITIITFNTTNHCFIAASAWL